MPFQCTAGIPTKGAKSGIVHRVIGTNPRAGMMMIVRLAVQEGPGHRGARRRARLGEPDLENGGEPSMRLLAGAVSSRLRLVVVAVMLGATGFHLPGLMVQ